MAAKYDTEDLKQRALKAIKEHDLIFLRDAFNYLPCTQSAAYRHRLNEDEDLIAEIERNRTTTKSKIRRKLYDMDNAIAQIALYKLLGSKEEVERLSNGARRIEHTGSVSMAHVVIEPKALADAIEGEIADYADEDEPEDIRLLGSAAIQ
jgi:hypothetical protein